MLCVYCVPLQDLVVTAAFAFLWLVSSSAWGKGLTDVKGATNPNYLVESCKEICTAGEFPSMGRLNASVVSDGKVLLQTLLPHPSETKKKSQCGHIGSTGANSILKSFYNLRNLILSAPGFKRTAETFPHMVAHSSGWSSGKVQPALSGVQNKNVLFHCHDCFTLCCSSVELKGNPFHT